MRLHDERESAASPAVMLELTYATNTVRDETQSQLSFRETVLCSYHEESSADTHRRGALDDSLYRGRGGSRQRIPQHID